MIKPSQCERLIPGAFRYAFLALLGLTHTAELRETHSAVRDVSAQRTVQMPLLHAFGIAMGALSWGETLSCGHTILDDPLGLRCNAQVMHCIASLREAMNLQGQTDPPHFDASPRDSVP